MNDSTTTIPLLKNGHAPLGMGCWAIGGNFFQGDTPLGFGDVDDEQSVRTVHAALDHGVTIFDTAAVYGAGHSERVLGKALRGRDAAIISKVGMAFDPSSKQLLEDTTDPKELAAAIDDCLSRLGRDHIDMMLLHQNTASVDAAYPLFVEMEKARHAGKIGAYGWSTDFPDKLTAMRSKAELPGFCAVEHAMNVFADVPHIQETVAQHGLLSLIRSPLGMGILTGKYTTQSTAISNDIRAHTERVADYFEDGKIRSDKWDTLAVIRELLQTGGRTLAQGALCWLWGKSPDNVPVPGAKTVAQASENAQALTFGPLPQSAMDEIEHLINRDPEEAPRVR